MGSVDDKIWLPIKLKKKSDEPLWSGISEALNAQPLYEVTQKKTLGLFHIAGLISEEGLRSTVDTGLEYLNRLVHEAEEPLRYRPSWEILEIVHVFFHEMESLMVFLLEHYPDDSYIQEAKWGKEKLDKLREKLKYSYDIYRGLVIDGIPENKIHKFIATHLIRQYEKLGFKMQDCDVDKIMALQHNLEELADSYSGITLRQSKQDVSASAIKIKVMKIDEILLFSDYRRRQEAYINFYKCDTDQLNIVQELLKARHDFALLLGFESFGRKALSETPFGVTSDVQFFLRYLSDGINEEVLEDFSIMSAIKENTDRQSFILSDINYIHSWAQERISGETDHQVFDYLTLGACIEGMNKVFQDTFYLQFDISSIIFDEVYSPDMYKLQVIHKTWGLVSYIFLDLMHRSGKSTETTHYVVREGKFEEDNEYISKKKWRPLRIVLIMSIELSGYPARLSVSEAENLFVEIGKLVPTFLYHFPQQYILRALSIIDYEDIFSVLMRRLFYHPKVMQIIFKLYPNGECIPPRYMNEIINSRKIFECSDYQMVILKSAVDNVVHAEHPLKHRLIDYYKKFDKIYFPVPMFDGCFIHLRDNYMIDKKRSGKIFMELVDKAVAINLWKRYFEADPLDPEKSDAFFMCMYETLSICDVAQCYAKLLHMDKPDLMKIAKILIEDARQRHTEALTSLENIIDSTKHGMDKSDNEYKYGRF